MFKNPFLWIPAFISIFIGYFAPLAGIAAAMLLAVVIDFGSGIWASKKRGEKIKSNIMRNSVTKLLCYSITIIFTFVIQKEIFIWEWAKLVNLATALIVLAELKSILENFGDITGNRVFNNIFKTISNMFKKNVPESKDNQE